MKAIVPATRHQHRFYIGLAIALLAVLPALVNLTINAFLQARYPVAGTFYRINGHSMHLYCTGHGEPTVVLEAGGGDDWLIWQRVQPEVAKITRVCSYDRAGTGWSKPQPGARDANTIAGQLHTLLQDAGESGPLVLAGASVGGFYVRQFAAAYPREVSGIVFVDSSTPEQIQAIPGSGYSAQLIERKHREVTIEWLKELSGWTRLSGGCKAQLEPALEAYQRLADAETCRPSYARSWRGEADQFWHSAEEVAQARCCGDIPILIISQDSESPQSAQPLSIRPIWNGLQEHLKVRSPNSRRIISRGSGHHVMIDRPDVVIDAIAQLVTGSVTHTANLALGSTSVE